MSGSTFLHDILAKFAKYNNARADLESCFNGLPHAPKILVNALITRADLSTGLVENINYRDLAACLTVDAAPGRRDSGTPTKQAVRNYLRTIQTQCGDHFQLSSEGQLLKITFPTLPDIYKSHVELPELHTVSDSVSNTAETIVNSESQTFFDGVVNTQESTDLHTEVHTLKQIEAINAYEHTSAKIKPNKLKPNNNSVSDDLLDLKKPITDDFFPSQFVIDKALSKGLPKVTDTAELTKFILFNQATGSQWKNFDYVYLNWLQRDAEREQAKKEAEQQLNPKYPFNKKNAGNLNHGTNSNVEKTNATQRVIAAHSDQFEFCSHTNRFNPRGRSKLASVRYLDIDTLGPID